MPLAPGAAGWLGASPGIWHFAAKRLFPMVLFLSPARPDAYAQLAALDEWQMSIRPQPCEVSSRRSGSDQASQRRGLNAERAAGRACVSESPQLRGPNPGAAWR